jgi:hypothetical protein
MNPTLDVVELDRFARMGTDSACLTRTERPRMICWCRQCDLRPPGGCRSTGNSLELLSRAVEEWADAACAG